MARDLSFQNAIGFARDLIRIPSPSGREGEVAERLRHEMERLRYDDVRVDGAGNVIGTVRGRGEVPPVMLSCHLDVVDPGDPLGWEHLPYSGDIEDGFLHGRGAMDIKGPLALQTYAAASLLESRPAGDVIVAHTVLEERGGWGMAHLLESGEVRPGAVIIGEATGGDVCIGHRGRAELEVVIRGLAGHASAPERARNALRPVGPVLAALDRFAAELEADDLLGRSTLAPTSITATPASRNVIPDVVKLVLDWRVLPGLEAGVAATRVRERLRELELPEGLSLDVVFATEKQRTYTGLERERSLFTPGFLLDPHHPVVEAAAEAVRRDTGRTPAVRPWTFATDGGHTCGVHGIPTLGYAPGEERFAHTNRERLELDPARFAYAAYPGLIRAVQEALG